MEAWSSPAPEYQSTLFRAGRGQVKLHQAECLCLPLQKPALQDLSVLAGVSSQQCICQKHTQMETISRSQEGRRQTYSSPVQPKAVWGGPSPSYSGGHLCSCVSPPPHRKRNVLMGRKSTVQTQRPGMSPVRATHPVSVKSSLLAVWQGPKLICPEIQADPW